MIARKRARQESKAHYGFPPAYHHAPPIEHKGVPPPPSRWVLVFASALSLATLLFPAGAAYGREASLAHCGGTVREIGRTHVKLGASGRRIEVRVRDRDDRPLAASGFVSTVIEGEPMRLELKPVRTGVLAVVAPQAPAAGSIAVVRLNLADGSRRGARLPLVQRSQFESCLD